MENLAKIKQRVILYLENQGIKKEDFYKKISSNGGNFRGKSLKSELSGEKIAEILAKYPDISAEWLLLGEGEMLKSNIKLKENEDEKVSKLLNIIEKQQDTINNQQEIINNLVNKQEKTSAHQDNDAECATA